MSNVDPGDVVNFLETIAEATREPGRGVIDVHPAFEEFMPNLPGLFWGGREVIDRETVRFEWVKMDLPWGRNGN